ncbi:SBBP repeat-containing protein [Mechercharimyces sp. CAU 1602]|uniref:SBBP repeat-containing protein n=1 Tax=Mechercharimyces sp. CAU 1602 TaxID=2973933 RepID=UPI0021615A69|nr:SBBP repeat-containing protein [Mechercharimyces sp. CAU 1602]MCS1351596.1 SBBP repeat-containing protein [Mechercharimyces sp. CAU 1602]
MSIQHAEDISFHIPYDQYTLICQRDRILFSHPEGNVSPLGLHFRNHDAGVRLHEEDDKIVYRRLWDGIDAILYKGRELKYEFEVSPGAKVTDIRFWFSGVKATFIDHEGNMQLQWGKGWLTDRKPISFQQNWGRPIVTSYQQYADEDIGFNIEGEYDETKTLIVDPVVIYSTYLAGSGSDFGLAIAVDHDGNAYVTGNTSSTNFPVTSGVFQTRLRQVDAFVSKLNASGTSLLFSTYLGGSNIDGGLGIAVASNRTVFVSGQTNSFNFPVTSGAFQTGLKGETDAFITKLSATGSTLFYSTYLGGGGQEPNAKVAIDDDGHAYVGGATQSTNFPVTSGAFQTVFGGNEDAYIAKLNPTGSSLLFATYIGGSGVDFGEDIALDSNHNTYITGFTDSEDFPITSGAFQTQLGGMNNNNAFITKLNAQGTSLAYSTYLGGSRGDSGCAITVDSFENAYVTGTAFSRDFPTTAVAFQTINKAEDGTAFVSKLNDVGSMLKFSTFLGGSVSDIGAGIAVDRDQNAWVVGGTLSTDFPITSDAYQAHLGRVGSMNYFVTQVSSSGRGILYSTFLGGTGQDLGSDIAVDTSNCVYLTGSATSNNFPTTDGAFQEIAPVKGGSFDFYATITAFRNDSLRGATGATGPRGPRGPRGARGPRGGESEG